MISAEKRAIDIGIAIREGWVGRAGWWATLAAREAFAWNPWLREEDAKR